MLIDRVKFFERKVVENQSRLPYAQVEEAIKEHDAGLKAHVLAGWVAANHSMKQPR